MVDRQQIFEVPFRERDEFFSSPSRLGLRYANAFRHYFRIFLYLNPMELSKLDVEFSS